MNLDLERARVALDMERPDDARVYAWKALSSIEEKDAPELAAIANELGDAKLLDELQRRGLRFTQPLVTENKPRSKLRFLPAALVLAIMAGSVLFAYPIEGRPPDVDEAAVAKRPEPHPRVLTLTDGVWLVPVARAESVDLQRIADELTFRYRIPVGVQAQVTLTPSSLRTKNDDLDAERVLELLARAYGAEGRAAVIGVTDYDMESETHGHVFTLRSARNYAIVSTAQLGASPLDRLRGHDRHERTRKLVARNVAFLHLGLPMVEDDKSLRRTSMSSIADIDELEERF